MDAAKQMNKRQWRQCQHRLPSSGGKDVIREWYISHITQKHQVVSIIDFEKSIIFKSNLEYQNGIPGLYNPVNEGDLMGETPQVTLEFLKLLPGFEFSITKNYSWDISGRRY